MKESPSQGMAALFCGARLFLPATPPKIVFFYEKHAKYG
jgi:hypothetical protein